MLVSRLIVAAQLVSWKASCANSIGIAHLFDKFVYVYWYKVVEQCKKEGSGHGVYLYHVADMSLPDTAIELLKVRRLQILSIHI